ncbi:FAD-dependent oxidoreductase [Bradyrhizobium diazoefficiens]|uniref:FAD-dependent oxidoreductase n=1 Tax=Bradyrhizobium diazoefficiens TaxID=1355477 RepID=UPI00190BE0EA|nr:FAD-dependent oxidoreductase [Bradyrhizobium diazoefficiens]MBK3665288.1 FAD-dependent oxidoreductase [Bradyrhizobium diazoefficiens]
MSTYYRTSGLLLSLILSLIVSPARAQAPVNKDILVYGGTAAGVMTAYSAARQGLHVVLLEPSHHLGGMVTGGLSATDLGNPQVIGGYAKLFYRRVAEHYGRSRLDRTSDWLSEPHVSEDTFGAMLGEAGVEVVFGARLHEHQGVTVENRKIVSMTSEDGREWRAKVFVDCSYEGDLLAQSGATYTWGRESAQTYGETLAGVRTITPQHQFGWPILAHRNDHQLYPEISPSPLPAAGGGDKNVQAYNYRLILTDDPANRLPLPKPDGYDPAQFALLARYLQDFQSHMGREPLLKDFLYPVRLPNHKADFNNNGPFSTDYIGHSGAYPDASYQDKQRIRAEHLRYTQGLLYFLTHDPVVPATLKSQLNVWGLPRDEFSDSDHRPRELYIREGRRMIGAYVVKQADLQTNRAKPDSIGMGSYNSDSHNVQRVAMPDGSVRNEGDMQVPVQPYQIPYRVMTPRKDEMHNLLVPVCLSASHVAYSSLRMEPQYMILGQAAGVAAALAAQGRVAVQDIPIAQLQRELLKTGAVLELPEDGVFGAAVAPPD